MLDLIFNLLFISCPRVGKTGELFELRIINCEDSNGNLVDSGFRSNKSFCKLKLVYDKNFWSIYISLYIGILPHDLHVIHEKRPEMIKDTENIVMGRFDKGFLSGYDDFEFIWADRYVDKKIDQYGYVDEYVIVTKNIQSKIPFKCHNDRAKKKIRSSVDLIKSTNLFYFRQFLGISGDKIEKTKFKFKFIYKVRHNIDFRSIFKTITFETEKFEFSANEDGTLRLTKTIKSKCCFNNLDLNQ
ncbi:hypothetical protein CDIK_2039 [Cucumispora dikerogammari]|nr:hypothetical protein CDIK_2039 [Cucumispora dikerogammari]